MKSFQECFPIWEKLKKEEKTRLSDSALLRHVPAGTLLRNGGDDCLGLVLVAEGQLRAFVLSPTGKEITLYRLLELDLCLFSASCAFSGLQFEVSVEAEKDTFFYLIPPEVFQALMRESAVIANYTSELMASRLSDVMWLVEQTLFHSFDERLAGFLLEESALCASETLTLTHEKIAKHLGTAREVVTRMLNYFSQEGMVALSRGEIELTERQKLSALAGR